MEYRCLPRPSSPHDAKASVVRPYTLGKKLPRLSFTLQFSSIPIFQFSKIKEMVPHAAGGGSRIRTGDFLLAKQALYQLSYAPEKGWWA